MRTYKGRYSRYSHSKIEIKGHVLDVGFGTGDDVEVFTQGGEIYVLSTNERLDYAALKVFDRNLDEVGEVFIDGYWKLQDIHPRFWDLTGNTQAKLLDQYIY